MEKLIRKAMIDSGVRSVSELSRRSGVPYKTLSNILNGKDSKLSTLVRIFDSMNFKLKYVAK